MKEVEKNEIKRLSDRLDAIRHQQADLSLVEAADKYAELEKEKATLEAEIARLREVHSQKLSKEAQKLMKMPFQRAITKKEQAGNDSNLLIVFYVQIMPDDFVMQLHRF